MTLLKMYCCPKMSNLLKQQKSQVKFMNKKSHFPPINNACPRAAVETKKTTFILHEAGIKLPKTGTQSTREKSFKINFSRNILYMYEPRVFWLLPKVQLFF